MNKVSLSYERITPKQAEAWLEHNVAYNRRLNTNHVLFLANEMRLRRFTDALIHFVYVENKILLINGQHTLHACIKSGKPFNAIVKREEVDDPSEYSVAMLYAHHDQNRRRNFSDTAKAFGLGEKLNLPDRWVNAVGSAIKFGRNGFRSRTERGNASYTSVWDLLELVQVWEKEAKLSHELFGTFSKNPFKNMSILSVALVTLYYQKEKAIEFWGQAALDDGLSIDDPRKTLHKYAHEKIIRPRWLNFDPVPRDVVSIAVSYCWNAYMEDRPLGRIAVREDVRGRPLTLVGTSYTGNQDPAFWPARNLELSEVEKIWQQVEPGAHAPQPAAAA